ncbi:MAG: hypothetical protein JWO60_3270, partial [Frankiales bacterium]|nr:hypothetical protein [Frankiales bacterium]
MTTSAPLLTSGLPALLDRAGSRPALLAGDVVLSHADL